MTPKPDAFEKRVKRQVTARDHQFYVVVSPGLGDICAQELDGVFDGQKQVHKIEGGIEFEGRLNDLYTANLCLRTASRIVMRIHQFTAENFNTLEKKVEAFPWELYAYADSPISVQVSVKKSRLYHSDAVKDRVEAYIHKRLNQYGKKNPNPSAPIPQTIHVRGINDIFTLSLDSSGELLHKRGLKTAGGTAPMRETLAAGMLLMADFNETKPLLDPMCGTGSFSIEATMIASKTPPGWHREFAFMNWPCFRPAAWEHLRKNYQPSIDPPDVPLIHASDIDPDTCEKMTRTVAKAKQTPWIRVSQRNFFEFKPPETQNNQGLILFNPPYGQRIGDRKGSIKLIRSIFKTLKTDFPGWHVGVISPFDTKTLAPGFPMTSIHLFHGGLDVYFLHGPIPG